MAANNAIMVGKEGTYGTAATLTRQYPYRGDGWKTARQIIPPTAMYFGQAASSSTRRKVVNMGGEGSLELDLLTNGMGLILESMFSTASGPSIIGTSTAFEQNYTTTVDGPATSLTVQLLRSKTESGNEDFTYLGAVCKGWELACEAGEDKAAMLKVEYDVRDSSTDVAAGTPDSLLPTRPGNLFAWNDLSIEINDSPITSFKKMSLKAEYNLDTDRRFLQGSALKKFPRRKGLPTYTGSIEGEFVTLDHYNAYINGTLVKIEFIFTGAPITGGDGENYLFHVTMPACEFTGDTPEMSLEELTKQGLQFNVLHDGTNPPISLRVVSDDTTLTGIDA